MCVGIGPLRDGPGYERETEIRWKGESRRGDER